MSQDDALLNAQALLYKQLIKNLGEDTERNGLVKTPLRAAKALAYLTKGYKEDINKIINGAIFDSDMDEMVIVKDIEFYSLCEHHILPFYGKCHVAYIPNGKVLGLSKVARIADMFARRLQIQENMTVQIANALNDSINAKGVAVVVEAQHLCMIMRGVEKQHSVMTTSCMLGTFREDSKTRMEFLNLINKR